MARPVLPYPRLRAGLKAWGLESADIIEIKPGVTSDVFLVMRGSARYVAKYCYDYRDYFEIGLRASGLVADRLSDRSTQVAVPVPTADGALTEMVEWPDGSDHPLALLTYVAGDPLPSDGPDGPEVLGGVCGRVHAALLDVHPSEVGLRELPSEPDGNYPDRDAGEFSWLHGVWRTLEGRSWADRDRVRHAIAVWDGPDIRRTVDGGVALLDFGHTHWHAVVHVIANRSLNAALSDESRLAPFLDAVERHLPLTDVERDLFLSYRLRNAAIYARWVAMERVARGDPSFNDAWFQQLLVVLRRGLPEVGVSAGEP